MDPEALALRGLCVAYGDVEVVHDVNLVVGRGELVYLMGRNGVGKTTTLRCVMGLIPSRAGSVWHEGEEIGGRPPHEIARRGIGFVPDNRRIFPFLTVRKNLELFAENRAESAGWTFDRICGMFPVLGKRASVKAGTLSGGEQEMLAVGRALMRNPKALLLDEPFEGLAPLVVDLLAEVFRQVKKETPILLVEQNERRSVQVADRCYRMDRGRIVSEFVPDAPGGDEGGGRLFRDPGRRGFWEI